jgi:hypothetical protein
LLWHPTLGFFLLKILHYFGRCVYPFSILPCRYIFYDNSEEDKK